MSTFSIGEWLVDPDSNSLIRGNERRQLEPRAMDVLHVLCRHANRIVSSRELLETCWENTLCGDNSLHKIIAQLRRVLGDKATTPVYIETIWKRGYRVKAALNFAEARIAASDSTSTVRRRQNDRRRKILPHIHTPDALNAGEQNIETLIISLAQALSAGGQATSIDTAANSAPVHLSVRPRRFQTLLCSNSISDSERAIFLKVLGQLTYDIINSPLRDTEDQRSGP